MDLKPSTGSLPPEWPSDLWADPEAERTSLRRHVERHRFGFSLLGLALVIASLSWVGHLILFFLRQRVQIGQVLGIAKWDFIEDSVVVWGMLLGVALLCGRWPDAGWSRRSGLLLLMCLVDVVLWGLDHCVELGYGEAKFGHEWFRRSLGTALGWSEFALIAGLAGDTATRLGEPQAFDFARNVRSLATTGAMIWFMFFYVRTDWNPPIWPLRDRAWDANGFMLYIGWLVLGAILLVQATALSLMAGRCCGRTLRLMAAEDRANDRLPSRSEVGWEELNGPSSRPKGGV